MTDRTALAFEDAPPAKVKVRARQQRAIETRQRIIAAAIEEFTRHGFQAASTRAIAETAGVPHTAVAYHFETKENLWREMFTAIMRVERKRFETRIEGLEGVDDTLKLKLGMIDFIRFTAGNPGFARIMHDLSSQSVELRDWSNQEFIRPVHAMRAELIRIAQAEGKFVAGDPYHLQFLFIGAVTRLFMDSTDFEALSGQSPFDSDFIDRHVNLCIELFFREPRASR